MSDLNKSTQWEGFFLQEALELEEKMKTLDVESLNKSKLRICLEHGILDWAQYEQWYMTQKKCSSLKASLTHEDVARLVSFAQKAELEYAQYDFWGQDLLPLFSWENHLVVIGLQYNEKLVSLGEHIFILSPPEILSAIVRKIADQKVINNVEEEISIDHSEVNDALEGLNFNQDAPKISFSLIQPASAPVSDAPLTPSPVSAVSPASVTPATVAATTEPVVVAAANVQGASSMFNTPATSESGDPIWDFISERHQEYSFEVKKQFDAFVILKISNNKTRIFKLDPDLARQNINPVIFEYNLESEGPFKTVIKNKRSDSFNMQQLGMYLSDFQHACLTPIIRGDQPVGFFVGFKKNPLSQQDKNLLSELAEETAS